MIVRKTDQDKHGCACQVSQSSDKEGPEYKWWTSLERDGHAHNVCEARNERSNVKRPVSRSLLGPFGGRSGFRKGALLRRDCTRGGVGRGNRERLMHGRGSGVRDAMVKE